MRAYEDLKTRFRRLNALREAAGMLNWDMSAMMPAGGAEARSEQLAALAVTCHELLSDPALAELLTQAEEESVQSSHTHSFSVRPLHQIPTILHCA